VVPLQNRYNTLNTFLVLTVREVFFQLISSDGVSYAENGKGLNIMRKIIETHIIFWGKKMTFNLFFLLN
jgi:hypothetical protein